MPLDIQQFREDRGGDPQTVRDSEKKRFNDPAVVDEVIRLDSEWRQTQGRLDELRKQLRITQKEVAALYKAKKPQDAASLKEKIKADQAIIKETDVKLEELAVARKKVIGKIGNIVHESVPVSDKEEDNAVLRTWGECRGKSDDLRHHHELLHMIGGYESERGARVAGHRGYFLTGPGVRLNLALQSYSMDFLEKKGYNPVYPPFFMNKDVMAETAQLSDFDDQLYKVSAGEDEKYLIATSEQPISVMHRSEWLQAKNLPIKYAGLSTCFRKEAGSHGRDAWGIFRVHQFEKIEQFVYCDPENSWEVHEQLIKVAEEFYQSLNIPYNVVNLVSAELNNAAAKKYDLEGWFPTLGVYRELVSCSNCTDYQSRAMETRFGQKAMSDREKKYVHMLNSTLCATTRTICCLLENNQTEEGVVVPEVLRPYMGGVDMMRFVREPPRNVNKAKMAKAKAKGKKPSK